VKTNGSQPNKYPISRKKAEYHAKIFETLIKTIYMFLCAHGTAEQPHPTFFSHLLQNLMLWR